MKKVLLLFTILIFTIFYSDQVAAKRITDFQCEYKIAGSSFGESVSKEGTLSCEMGYETVLFIKNAITICKWNSNGVSVDVTEKNIGKYNFQNHLKNGETTCPPYVAMETTTSNGVFSGSAHAFFTDDYKEAQEYIKSKKYYALGSASDNSNSELNQQMCNSMNEEHYKSLLDSYQEKIETFKENQCDEFTLTEKEKETVASVESTQEYKECKETLNVSDSQFENSLNELKTARDIYHCFDDETYKSLYNDLSSYKNEFSLLKANLDKSFELNSNNNNNQNNNNTNNNLPTGNNGEEPDYKVDTSANINNICTQPSYRKPARFIGIIINFMRIIVPILIIAFGALDFYKAIIAQKDGLFSKAIIRIIIRGVAGVFIFLLPGIVQFIIQMVTEWNQEGYQNAWCCCTDCILNSQCDVNACSSSCHIEGTNNE